MTGPEWRPVNEVAGAGPIPKNRSAARAYLRRHGIPMREGAGNGGRRLEVDIAALPEVQAELAKCRAAPLAPQQERDRELWADFARLPGAVRQRAERRLRLALEVERLVAAGASRTQAVELAAQDASLTARAVWRVLQRLSGVGRANWLPALATTSAGLPAVEPAWARPLLKLYRAPQKPSLADALARLPETLPQGATLPSYGQAKRYVKRMSAVERARGRLGPNALKAIKAFTRRTVEGLRAGDVFIADGHSFDSEVMHPSGGQPCRPELTCVLCVATRLWVGWSAALAEGTWAVSDALRDAIERHGVPAIYYADRGPGHDNAALDGILKRIGITRERSIARNSQARGVIEAFNQRLIAIAKRLPSYIGADMDADAKRVVHIRSRQELRATGASRLLPSWSDMLAMIEGARDEYNRRPHAGLPRIVDPSTGRTRHQTPAEAWDALVAEHGAPPQLSAEMFRPQELRKTRRGEVKINGLRYFARHLEHLDGSEVLVGYDPRDGSQVWVHDLQGRLVAVAERGANNAPYFPESRLDAARQARARGRERRLLAKVDDVRAELAGPRAAPAPAAPPAAPPALGRDQGVRAMELIERLNRGEALSNYEQGWLVLVAANLVTREAKRNQGRRAKRNAELAAPDATTPRPTAEVVALPKAAKAPALPYPVVEYSGNRDDDQAFARARWLEGRQAAGEPLDSADARWLSVAQAEPWYRSLAHMEAWRARLAAKAAG